MSTVTSRLTLAIRRQFAPLPAYILRLRAHVPYLAVIAFGASFAQYFVLKQQPLIQIFPNSQVYLTEAHQIGGLHQIIFPYQPTVYPLFLAVVLGIGGNDLKMVVAVQAVLTVAAAFEIYVLAYRLTRQSLIACIIATLIGANLYIADWERAVLAETLSYWLVVTIFLIVERYVTVPRASQMVWFGILSAVGILLRPSLVALPAVLLVSLGVWMLWRKQLRQHWKTLALGLVITYGSILGYMTLDKVQNHYFGISYVANVNPFGKLIEYHMVDLNTDPRFARLRADTDAFVSAGNNNPWLISQDFPTRNYQANYYAELAAYTNEVVLHHSATYVAHTVNDVYAIWTAQPSAYTPFSAASKTTALYLDISAWMLNSYFLLPVLLVLLAARLWSDPDARQDVTLMIIVIALATNIIFLAFGLYDEFYRLRSTFDWGMILVSGILLSRLLPAKQQQQLTSSPATPTESDGKQNGATGDNDQLPTLPRISATQP
jgi:hypothetical protein